MRLSSMDLLVGSFVDFDSHSANILGSISMVVQNHYVLNANKKLSMGIDHAIFMAEDMMDSRFAREMALREAFGVLELKGGPLLVESVLRDFIFHDHGCPPWNPVQKGWHWHPKSSRQVKYLPTAFTSLDSEFGIATLHAELVPVIVRIPAYDDDAGSSYLPPEPSWKSAEGESRGKYFRPGLDVMLALSRAIDKDSDDEFSKNLSKFDGLDLEMRELLVDTLSAVIYTVFGQMASNAYVETEDGRCSLSDGKSFSIAAERALVWSLQIHPSESADFIHKLHQEIVDFVLRGKGDFSGPWGKVDVSSDGSLAIVSESEVKKYFDSL